MFYYINSAIHSHLITLIAVLKFRLCKKKIYIYIIILISFIKCETSLFFSNDNKHIDFTYDVPSFYDITFNSQYANK